MLLTAALGSCGARSSVSSRSVDGGPRKTDTGVALDTSVADASASCVIEEGVGSIRGFVPHGEFDFPFVTAESNPKVHIVAPVLLFRPVKMPR